MRRRVDPAAAVLAAAAFVWHVVLMTTAANDNFMHMAMAQQWLGGDWPVRDFFDNGRLLQFSLSAIAQLTFGDRLLGEAIVVGLTWAVSTYVVFTLVRRLTGSPLAAALASLLLIVAGARGYSYPKGIVYAVAAMFWWSYVRRPAMATAISNRRHLLASELQLPSTSWKHSSSAARNASCRRRAWPEPTATPRRSRWFVGRPRSAGMILARADPGRNTRSVTEQARRRNAVLQLLRKRGQPGREPSVGRFGL